MPKYLRMLLARGYWEQANDGTSGSTGGGGGTQDTDDKGSTDSGKDDTKASDETSGSGKSGDKKPTDAEAELLREVMEKKDKIKKLNDQLEQASAQLKKFDGLDAEQIRAMLAEAEERKTKELEAKGQWDALRKQLVDQHTAAVSAKENELKALRDGAAALQSQIAELTVGTSFANSSYIKEKLAVPPSKARAVYGAHFEFNGSEVVAYDKPKGAANRTVLVDAKGDALSFEAAIERLVMNDPDRDYMLKGALKTGAGSRTDDVRKDLKEESTLSGRDRIRAALSAKK